MCSLSLVLTNYMVAMQHNGRPGGDRELHTTPYSPPLVSYMSAIEQGTATTEYEKNAWSRVANAESRSHTGSYIVKK